MSNTKNNRCEKIIIRGARVNNLKNINIDIPRNKFVVITGLSGSGKSSLAFDTIFAEGNRRYMEGLSSYARNFLDLSTKPDIDKIENLSPSISIDQKSISRSPRSTVGTLTEVYDYLRVLFSKIGKVHCSECGSLMSRKNTKEMTEEVLKYPDRTSLAILAKFTNEKDNLKETLRQIKQWGYARVRFNGIIMTVSEALMIADDSMPVEIEVVIDRLMIDCKNPDRERIIDSLETAVKIGRGAVIVSDGKQDQIFNQDYSCFQCNFTLKEITARHFSFNNPEGACSECFGLGYVNKISPELIVPNKKLTLSEGAIQPWSKSGGKINNQTNYLAILEVLKKFYGIPIDVPFNKIKSRDVEILLYGDKEGSMTDSELYPDSPVRLPFEGIISSLEKKYLDTKSDFLRSEIEKYMITLTCPVCSGRRLKKEYLSVLVNGKSINDLVNMSVTELKNFFQHFEKWEINQREKKIVQNLAKELINRLESIENVGLEYLNMARSAETISGGEAQRIRLAVQLNSRLMGITYVLDEPSIGLHSRDIEKLINTIKLLKDLGNSLIIVEHDEKIIRFSDWVIDMGPGAGEEGGEIIFEGSVKNLINSGTKTALYLSGAKKIFEKKGHRPGNKKSIEVIGAEENNLKKINFKIPLEKFIVVCGVSGSGKSTLVQGVLAKALSKKFHNSKSEPGKHKTIKGLENIDKVISINQDPIGKTPRSNAATYTGIFSHIRDLFAETEESKSRGYQASRFSFNMKGGRCEVCQGDGMQKIEMHLLPDVYVKCEACEGTRYNKKTLEIEFKGYNIARILDMDVNFALCFFNDYPLIYEKLKTMKDVGLGYLRLGQSATNLSGGEAQRIKLATELSRKSTGRTLYILDEPTVGLHFEDIKKLLEVLNALVDKGNTVLVVEHNLDVIKSADWVVELGEEGGNKGGYIIYEGIPEKLKKCKKSWTAKYL